MKTWLAVNVLSKEYEDNNKLRIKACRVCKIFSTKRTLFHFQLCNSSNTIMFDINSLGASDAHSHDYYVVCFLTVNNQSSKELRYSETWPQFLKHTIFSKISCNIRSGCIKFQSRGNRPYKHTAGIKPKYTVNKM